MKISFFSNFLNHHQLPFCLEMQKRIGNNFTFVATEPFNQSVVSKGYEDMNTKYDFVLRSYDSAQAYQQAYDVAMTSDVIILGSAPKEFIYHRLIKNPKGITFRYSERICKGNDGKIDYKNRYFYFSYLQNLLFRYSNFYLLAASCYAPYDYARYGFNKNKMFKWGYFPTISEKSFLELIDIKSKKLQLVWAGRIIDWKHLEHAILVAEKLKQSQLDFVLKIIGDGEEKAKMEQLVAEKELSHVVMFLGSMDSGKVRQEMEQSHIHLFTSDYNEGWGAVLNESMASGCVPIASVCIGASGYLIQNGVNGYVYPKDDVDKMYECVMALAADKEKMMAMQKQAFQTIAQQWNAKTASANLILLCESLKNKTVLPQLEGPASKAGDCCKKFK